MRRGRSILVVDGRNLERAALSAWLRTQSFEVCGELASEPIYTMLLIGLGLRILSLVPSQIPHVKRVVRSVDIATCERLARKVGSFDSERQVMNTLRAELQKILPESEGVWSAD